MNVELISFSGELGNQLDFFLFLTVTTEMQETSMILKHPKITFCQRLLYKSPKVIAGKATPIANIFFMTPIKHTTWIPSSIVTSNHMKRLSNSSIVSFAKWGVFQMQEEHISGYVKSPWHYLVLVWEISALKLYK